MSGTDSQSRSTTGPLGELVAAIESTGLVTVGDRGVALVSGGADSACLAAGLAAFTAPDRLVALHLNYGLRPEADADQDVASRLCRGLGVELVVHRAGTPAGNLQEWARDLRYGIASKLREQGSLDWVAAGHSRSDLVETVLYRLAASPGTRPLLGMKARRGNLIRPLIGLGRDDLRRIAIDAGLPFVDDRSNTDVSFARARIRNEVLPSLRRVNPGVERNVARTVSELAEDEDLLATLASEAIGGDAVEARVLRALHPALRRRCLRLLAEATLDRPVPVPAATAAEVLRLALHPEGGRIDAGGGAFFLARRGLVRVERPDRADAGRRRDGSAKDA